MLRDERLMCEVQFDNEKIIKDDIYTPESVRQATDEMFVDKFDLVKGENGFYYEKGCDEDFIHFMSAILSLRLSDWFMKYVSKWLWYNPDNCVYPEDMIAALKDIKA